MVLEFHVSEFEPKQPQLEPKPHGADPQGLPMAKPDRNRTNYRKFITRKSF